MAVKLESAISCGPGFSRHPPFTMEYVRHYHDHRLLVTERQSEQMLPQTQPEL